MGRLSVHQLKEWKKEQRRFAMVTAYDYSAARLVEQAGIPIILVGDSVGSVMLGYDSTVPVTMDEIVHHTKPVVRATEKTIVVADLPFGSYQVSEAEAMANAMRLLKEGGATAVKLEGGAHVAPLVRKMVDV
ncbi:MAG: 3-methyl-2-oxobutanoate hydroxymethyltransferase, partial [Dehalococcoidia bacterium]|nr:3-methyl-2-oxobutanoate hydroxymethyltransferase [Dehalococcoidia bacterium]